MRAHAVSLLVALSASGCCAGPPPPRFVSLPVLDGGTHAFDAPTPVDAFAADVFAADVSPPDAHDGGPADADAEPIDAPSDDVLIGDAPVDAE